MLSIDRQIYNIDSVICRHFDNTGFSSRGAVSQDVLSQLRNFLEHIMLKFYSNGNDITDSYENICKAIDYVQTRGNLKLLYQFHGYLQIVASHYTLDEENSERLMLKYYVYLRKVRSLLKTQWNMDVLSNLERFPLNTDETLQEYYDRIADKIRNQTAKTVLGTEKYYIQKIKPFFSGTDIFYEVTFTSANDHENKHDRVIAFSQIDINDNYAVKFSLTPDSIEILGKTMPILIINNWEVAIRDCEYQNFSSIIRGTTAKTGYPEQQAIARFLTTTGYNLVDLLDFSCAAFERVKREIAGTRRQLVFFEDLETCRQISSNHNPGENILRYLLFHMNNRVIKKQRGNSENELLSRLYLQNGCIPFEKMPFISSLIGHNPKLGDLFACIPSKNRKHELLARKIRNNTEISAQLFTTVTELQGYDDVEELVREYNRKLWFGHRDRSKLVIENGQIFINEYKEDTCQIIQTLQKLSCTGITNYSNTVRAWLSSPACGVDSEEKKEALLRMFASSHVSIVYGSAGTGKSTLINHVSHFFSRNRKLYLAQTHPAIDSLKRKVTAGNVTFMTIAKFLSESTLALENDLLIIDECSTVSNRDMRAILEKAKYKLLLLVGDTYQISSIRFGNWFSLARAFIPANSVFELTDPYRTKSEGLLRLWDKVRHMDGSIQETIARNDYSVTLDASIFAQAENDEVILCLNYDGLYGINNINRFLQESNPNHAVSWGIQQFKVGDPILFNETERFAPAVYNNTKGRIVGIKKLNEGELTEKIQFDVELTKVLNELDAFGCDFELLENSPAGNSVIRFTVNKRRSTDEDDDYHSARTVIPFQIAYAVSIHKAQGLEYGSVKVVITDEVDELITHNIFYTAITRAQRKLKIYWTPEVENKILTSIKPKDIRKDLGLMRRYIQ